MLGNNAGSRIDGDGVVSCRTGAAVMLCLCLAATGGAQQRLEDVVPLLPDAERWMAQCKDAFAFCYAPLREDVAWFVMRARENSEEGKLGHYEIAWTDRAGGEVRSADLGKNLCNEDWFVGPVWNSDATRIAVAIAYRDEHQLRTRVVVIDTKTAAPSTWLEDAWPASLSWTGDGRTLAVVDGGCVRVLKGPADELWRAEIPQERGWGSAAAISPDGGKVLAVSGRGVFLIARGAEKPERLGDVQLDATIFTAPQWSPDGTKAVAVAGGAVTLIDVGRKVVRCVGETTLGGRAHAVVWAPGALHAMAFVEQVRDGSLLELLLGAGHARQRYSALPVLVAGAGDRVLPLTRMRTKTPDPRFTKWFYRPRLSEALSRWSR